MSTPEGPPEGEIERELKFARVELEALRERLLELEAERVFSPTTEDNWILDQGEVLRGRGCLLRLRRDGHGARLTYKGPVTLEGRMKIRSEQETEVSDADKTLALFQSLGYEVSRRYQKVRETWHLGGVTICLDRTPIGDFAEFEGEGAETVAKRCHLDPEEAERRSYLRLYDDYLETHPDAPPDMQFS